MYTEQVNEQLCYKSDGLRSDSNLEPASYRKTIYWMSLRELDTYSLYKPRWSLLPETYNFIRPTLKQK